MSDVASSEEEHSDNLEGEDGFAEGVRGNLCRDQRCVGIKALVIEVSVDELLRFGRRHHGVKHGVYRSSRHCHGQGDEQPSVQPFMRQPVYIYKV